MTYERHLDHIFYLRHLTIYCAKYVLIYFIFSFKRFDSQQIKITEQHFCEKNYLKIKTLLKKFNLNCSLKK